MRQYRFFRDRGPQNYIAIITDNKVIANVIYRQNDLLKTEEFQNRKGFSDDVEKSFESLMRWWQHHDNETKPWIHLYDGKIHYQVNTVRDTLRASQRKEGMPNKGLSEICWPNIEVWAGPGREWKVIENDYSIKNNLICIELLFQGHKDPHSDTIVYLPKRRLYYIDPEHAYICVRQEWYQQRNAQWQNGKDWFEKIDSEITPSDSMQVSEVIEFARIDSGHWYPKRIKTRWSNNTATQELREAIKTIYLNTDPEFPEGSFDPANLPQ